MNDVSTLTRQHLIDPELCVRCDGCAQVCGKHAIQRDYRNYAVDPSLCDGCMDCVQECSTGAVNSWRWMPKDLLYSVSTQLEWSHLPPPELVDVVDAPPAGTHLPHAPASTPVPTTEAFDRLAPAKARILENRRATPAHADADIHHLVLMLEGTALETLEGQSIGIVPPGVDANGHPHAVRMYSIASPRTGEQDVPGTMSLTVKRVTRDTEGQPVHGLCSNYLCDLAPGESVQVVGPYGKTFLMPDAPDSRLILVAAGTGIAPMRAMLARRRSTNTDGADRVALFYGGRLRDELPYVDDLEAAAAAGSLSLHLALSRVPGQPKRHVQDALLEQARQWITWLAEQDGYLFACGPRGLRTALTECLQQACFLTGRDPEALMSRLHREHRLHIETY